MRPINLKTLLTTLLSVIAFSIGFSQSFIEPTITLQNTTIAQTTFSVNSADYDWGDYDNDGDMDVAVVGQLNNQGVVGAKIFRNDGNNVFYDIRANIPSFFDQGQVRWGDFDNDGDLDLFMAGGYQANDFTGIAQLIRNNGNNIFTPAANLPGVNNGRIALEDFDRDGKVDIVYTGTGAFISTSGRPEIYLYRNKGSFQFELAPNNFEAVAKGALSWIDYDNDGLPDLFVTGNTFQGAGKTTLYHNTRSGFEVSSFAFPSLTHGTSSWGDFNNDGFIDVLHTGSGGNYLYKNNGNGTFTDVGSFIDFFGGAQTNIPVMADVDTDGDLDLVGTHVNASISYEIEFFLNNGAGVFSSFIPPTNNYGHFSRAVTFDYNNDSKPDLSFETENESGAGFRVWVNQSTATNSGPTVPGNLSYALNGNELTLSWSASSDAQTPSHSLQYNFYFGGYQVDKNIFVPHAIKSSGKLTVTGRDGNAGRKSSVTFPNFKKRGNFAWSVQALDPSTGSSAFAPEQIFYLDNQVPVILGQKVLNIDPAVSTSLTINATDLYVSDDNVYPDDFTFYVSRDPATCPNFSLNGKQVTEATPSSSPCYLRVFVDDGNYRSDNFTIVVSTIRNTNPQITGQQVIKAAKDLPFNLSTDKLIFSDAGVSSLVLETFPGPHYTQAGSVVTPDAGFIGTLKIPVILSGDKSSNMFEATVEITEFSENHAPVITGQHPIAFNEDNSYVVGLTDLIITDEDGPLVAPTLTILPGGHYTFSGTTITPEPNYNGELHVPVKVSDGIEQSATFTLLIKVNPVNEPPTALDTEFILSSSVNEFFTFQFPPNLFNDPNNSALTYSLSEANGQDISWLTFDPATLTISGTPGDAQFDAELFILRITADNGSSSSSFSNIFVWIYDFNSEPYIAEYIPEQVAHSGQVYSYVVPASVFGDSESPTLSFSLKKDGGALPAWIHFNPWTREVSGTPAEGDAGAMFILVTATDQNGLSINGFFKLSVYDSQPAKNIQLITALADIQVPVGTDFFDITFPQNILATYNDASTESLPVSFGLGNYDGAAVGTYVLEGTFDLVFNTTNSLNLKATVNVIVGAQPAKNIISVSALGDINVAFGTVFSSVVLPSLVQVTYDDASTESLSVTFAQGTYNGNSVGTYVLAGTLTLSANTTNSQNKKASVNVNVQAQPVKNIASVASLSDMNVAFGTLFNTIPFPSTVQVTYDNATTENLNVSFAQGTYSSNVAGTYTVAGMLALSANTTNTNALKASVKLIVSKGNQTITFSVLADKTMGDAPFQLNASASSTLAINYSTTSDKVTLSGSQVTITKAGRASIRASQAGDGNYNAAISVDQSFCIKPSKPVVTLSQAQTATPVLTSSSSTGNQWFFNGALLSGASNNTLSITQPGVYTLQVSADDCKSAMSDNTPIIVTGDLVESLEVEMKLYPNPLEDELHVSWPATSSNSALIIYQTDGKEVERINSTESTSSIDVRQYARGQYILLVKTKDASYSGRFVKN